MPREERDDGLVVAHQAPPPAAASFSATFIAPAGFAYDPPGLGGLALTTSLLLSSGAGSRDRRTFARELDRLGGTLTARCDPESTEVTVWGPSSASRPLLALLGDAVVRPRLPSAELERVRRQVRERQLREMVQPDARAERELFRLVFPTGHPYRESGLGGPTSIVAVGSAEVRRFHREHFRAPGSSVVVTGPGTLATAVRDVRRAFDGLPDGRGPGVPPLPPPRRLGASRREVTLPGRSQVEIRVGGPTVPRSAPEFDGAFLANEVLGGRPLLSRLFQRVREAHGLAYHASSELDAMSWGGHWLAQAGTGPERVGKVLPLLEEEVERIRAELVPARELDAVRESAIGELPLGLETTSTAHELALDVTYHRLPEDHLLRWPDRLREVAPSELRASASIAFDATRTGLVVVGPSLGR